MTTLFFDSYALIELVKGNPNYIKYKQGVTMVTTRLNLMEMYYALIRESGFEVAEEAFIEFKPFAHDFDDDLLKEAMFFRLQNAKKELSYVDCIGYHIARSRGFKFLTGDKAFEKMENVEFVR